MLCIGTIKSYVQFISDTYSIGGFTVKRMCGVVNIIIVYNNNADISTCKHMFQTWH